MKKKEQRQFFEKNFNLNLHAMNSSEIQDSLHEARRFSELPQSIQIARINGMARRDEITEAERLRRIFSIRARFE